MDIFHHLLSLSFALLIFSYILQLCKFFHIYIISSIRWQNKRILICRTKQTPLRRNSRLLKKTKRRSSLGLILFHCAKRSILPDKTTLLENELARLQSKFHSAKSQNSSLDYSFSLISFEQTDRMVSTEADYAKTYKLVEKIWKWRQ